MESLPPEQGQVTQLVHHSQYLGVLEAYDNYVKGLNSMQLYTSNFTFSHHKAYDLTKKKFHALMDEYKIPKPKRYGSKAMSVVVPYADEASIVKKTILVFARSRKKKYDVLVAEVSSSNGLNLKRYALSSFFSAS